MVRVSKDATRSIVDLIRIVPWGTNAVTVESASPGFCCARSRPNSPWPFRFLSCSVLLWWYVCAPTIRLVRFINPTNAGVLGLSSNNRKRKTTLAFQFWLALLLTFCNHWISVCATTWHFQLWDKNLFEQNVCSFLDLQSLCRAIKYPVTKWSHWDEESFRQWDHARSTEVVTQNARHLAQLWTESKEKGPTPKLLTSASGTAGTSWTHKNCMNYMNCKNFGNYTKYMNYTSYIDYQSSGIEGTYMRIHWKSYVS